MLTGTGDSFIIRNVLLANGNVVPIGQSRSSPAFDRQGHVYAAADTDFEHTPGSGNTYPILFCVDPLGVTKWVVGLAENSIPSVVGSASPVVTKGPRGDSRAYMVASDGVQAVVEAVAGISVCPTSDALLDCSGHGSCDCAMGTCACDGCWSGDFACGTYNPGACQNGGSCDPFDGTCLCANACFSGPKCEVQKQCGNGGTCNPVDGSCSCPGTCLKPNSFGVCNNFSSALCNGFLCGAGGECACPAYSCLTGPSCTTPVDCGNGICDGLMGGDCVCDACYLQDATGSCTVKNTCSSHGTCQPATGDCVCATGWYGPSCSSNSVITLSPSPAPGGGGGSAASGSSKGLTPGAAAGVSLTVLALLAGGGVFAFMRAFPGKGVAEALGIFAQRFGLGGAATYTTIKPVAPASAAASGARLASLSTANTAGKAAVATPAGAGFSLLKGASPGVAERVSLLAKSGTAGAKPYGSK